MAVSCNHSASRKVRIWDQVSHSLAATGQPRYPRPSEPVQSKLDTFLLTIATRDWRIFERSTHETPTVGNGQLEENWAPAKDPTVQAVIGRLALQALDQKTILLSVATNIAYWELGEAYSTFVEVNYHPLRGMEAERLSEEGPFSQRA